MVVIRLTRGGAKKRPFYHVVAIDSREARDSGNYIERLGYFNPVARGAEVRLHFEHERVNHWLSQGGKPSERVAGLLVEAAKVATGESTNAQKRKSKLATKQAAQKIQKAAGHASTAETSAEA